MENIAVEDQFTSGVYGKREVCFVKGEGTRLWDDAGKEYIDCGAGIAVASLGHAHPKLVAAISEQAGTLMTAPELAYNDKRAQLLERLAGILPEGMDRIFLCNSGTEAIEGCLKFARVATGRNDIVATMRGFHGRTMGALSATHNKKYRAPFGQLVPGFTHVPFNNIEKMTAAVTEQTAAVVVEVLQGEGGLREGSVEYFQQLRALCDEKGVMLIFDEVQTGFCRTGEWFACNGIGVYPDLMAMGKAIAGGVPMGAIGIGAKIPELKPGMHGSTFGGNPLACAAALAAIDIYEEEQLAANAREMGDYFRERLAEINSPLIREIRGLGLMVGVELKVRVGSILRDMMERGVLVLNAGPTVLRFVPPLIITKDEIDVVVGQLTEALVTAAEAA